MSIINGRDRRLNFGGNPELLLLVLEDGFRRCLQANCLLQKSKSGRRNRSSLSKHRPPATHHFILRNLPCLRSVCSSHPTSWPTLANAPLVAGYRRYPPRRSVFSFFGRSDCVES